MKLLAVILLIAGGIFVVISAVLLIQSIKLGNQYLKNQIEEQQRRKENKD